MTRAPIQQRRAGSSPPGAMPAAGTRPTSAVRHGHYAMIARMVSDFELAAERLTDLDEIPLDLLERFAWALNRAERAALARVKHFEEATE